MAVQYAFIASNGEVQHVMSMGADSDFVDGQVYNGLTAKAVASATDAQDLMNTKYYLGEQWHTREARTTQWQDWVDNAWSFNSERFWVHVRNERDVKLGQSDWTQIADSPLSGEAKAEWATYREALRDVPANNQSATSTEGVSWPTEPGG